MVRYLRRYRLRRRARPLRRYRRPRYNLRRRRRSSRSTPRATRVVTRTYKTLLTTTRVVKWDDPQGEGTALAIKLTDYSAASDEAAHYDQFRINWAKWTFKPSGNLNGAYQDEVVENGLSVGKLGPPMIASYVDHDDDSTVPSSINACITRGGKMATWPNKLTMKWKPRPLTMLYESTSTTAYGLRSRPTWVTAMTPPARTTASKPTSHSPRGRFHQDVQIRVALDKPPHVQRLLPQPSRLQHGQHLAWP